MATKVHMEALSPTMEEGQLVRWLKQEGDAVSEGDVLAEIETDKATMELVARGSGKLAGIQLREGETAPVGQVIAYIVAEGEEVPGGAAAPAAAAPAAAAKPEPAPAEKKGAPEEKRTTPEARDAARAMSGEGRAEEEHAQREQQQAAGAEGVPESGAPSTVAPAAGAPAPEGRIKASPLARRLAAEAGLELAGVPGSGQAGRITKRDVEAAVSGAPAARAAAPAAAAPAAEAPAAPAAAPAAALPYAGPEVEEVPVTQMRKTIAKRLVTSIGPVPTFYLTIEVDARRLVEARQLVNARLEQQGIRTSLNDFIIKAAAAALAKHPEVNASWGEGVIRRHHRVHIGVAVAIEDGLITPVVRDANRKPVREIAAEVQQLAARAREKKLQPDEYTGATFSISNLGMFGIEEFTAIINPPEAAILAVGQVADKVVAEEGRVEVRPRMRLTMSCDHRVIDGATGARFLQTLRECLEEPLMILA